MTTTPTTWKFATAPGALPVLGHLLQLRHGLLGFIHSLPALGDLVEIRFGTWRGYVICHPMLTHQVLVDDRTFDKGGPVFDKAREIMGTGVLTCPHRDHRQQRRMLQPAFAREQLPVYAHAMTEQITVVLDGWRDGQVIEVPTEMNSLTSRTLLRTLFTSEHAAQAADAMQESLPDLMRGIHRHMLLPSAVLGRIPTPANRRFSRALTRIREAAASAVRDYRRADLEHADLLSALLSARDDSGRPLSDTRICDELLTLLLAGTETTASALIWALHLVATHPEIQQQLHTEVDSVLGGKPATWADLPHLEVTGRIISESLRLYPPAWLLTRTVSADTELAGRSLPAGSTLIFSPYLIHHRADLYGDPERFDPDRWCPQQPTQRSRHGSIPFGAGARKCIGESYAMTQACLFLASIAGRWHLEPGTRTPVRPAPRAALRPQDLKIRLQPRVDA